MNQLCINNIRVLCSEMIDKAKSGHPGMAIGAAPILHVLYTKILKASSENPDWFNRDYFVYQEVMLLVYYILYYIYQDIKFQWKI